VASLYHLREDWQYPGQPIDGPVPQAVSGTWVIHYPGSPSSYEPKTNSEVISYLRNIQESYVSKRGYSLGYSYGVSQAGSAWEIRGEDFNNAANAGRKVEGNFNDVSKSILVMVGGKEAASVKAVAKINALIATQPTWKVIIHGDVDYTSCCGAGLIHQVRTGIIGHQDSVTPLPVDSAVVIDGYNPPDSWWLFPIDSNKPDVKNGSENAHVIYLQDVIYFYCGGAIRRDGIFGDETKQRVKDFQGMFRLTIDGWVGLKTWASIDYVVTLNMKEPEPPKPIEPPTDVETLSTIAWYINKDDRPWSVGGTVYGSGAEGAAKLDHDAFLGYSTPRVAVFVDTPGISGKRATVQSGEGALAILRRIDIKANNANLAIFWDWNGGSERVYQTGDIVHMP
jgi:peptidoglycan hydrolase-like protein with peptidoglycan-binding domain